EAVGYVLVSSTPATSASANGPCETPSVWRRSRKVVPDATIVLSRRISTVMGYTPGSRSSIEYWLGRAAIGTSRTLGRSPVAGSSVATSESWYSTMSITPVMSPARMSATSPRDVVGLWATTCTTMSGPVSTGTVVVVVVSGGGAVGGATVAGAVGCGT